MLQLNSTLFLQIINFLLLMWILNRLLFRPFLKMVEEREAKTLGARTQAGDLTVEAEDLKKNTNRECLRPPLRAYLLKRCKEERGSLWVKEL